MKNDYEAEIPYVQTEDGFSIHRPFLENCKRDLFADTVLSNVMCVVEGGGVEKKLHFCSTICAAAAGENAERRRRRSLLPRTAEARSVYIRSREAGEKSLPVPSTKKKGARGKRKSKFNELFLPRGETEVVEEEAGRERERGVGGWSRDSPNKKGEGEMGCC